MAARGSPSHPGRPGSIAAALSLTSLYRSFCAASPTGGSGNRPSTCAAGSSLIHESRARTPWRTRAACFSKGLPLQRSLTRGTTILHRFLSRSAFSYGSSSSRTEFQISRGSTSSMVCMSKYSVCTNCVVRLSMTIHSCRWCAVPPPAGGSGASHGPAEIAAARGCRPFGHEEEPSPPVIHEAGRARSPSSWIKVDASEDSEEGRQAPHGCL